MKPFKQLGLLLVLAVLAVLVFSGVFGLWPRHPERTAAATSQAQGHYDELVGWYELDADHFVLITWAAQGALRLLDFDAHTSRPLTPDDDTSFQWQPRKQSPQRKLYFERDDSGRVARFRWHAPDGQEGAARRAPEHGYGQQEIHFANGDVNLVGTLLLPRGQGPHPVAVFIHGSGSSDRDNLWYFGIADHLARQGIAAFLPDKRGSGQSGGNWRTASFKGFARDTLAAVALLGKHPQIDPGRIGLLGCSQGGWIAPLAASLSSTISFIVNLSGAAVTPNQQLLHESEQTLVQDGWSPSLAAGMASPAAAIAKLRRPKWWWLNGDFDPIPHWQELRIPVLVVYGEEDEKDNVPVEKSVARFNQAIQPGENRHFTLKVLPHTGHGFLNEKKTWIREDFLQLLAGWITENVTKAPAQIANQH